MIFNLFGLQRMNLKLSVRRRVFCWTGC